ncbi:unnamed protein product [Clonostachys solani]|uniref:Uncharacterized protein n=1 Tax=Clonostachys solani TaxID=160281 RepID=A0A9P0EGH3_9HYPO|nr:unnamed protein product [Clonostachys solani]
MHHLTFLFAAGLISTISAAPLPAANDALLDFQERSGYADDDAFAQVARSLDALDRDLQERGLFSKTPKPFNPEKTPNKLKKAQPIPKVPNKQPKTANTLKKEKKGPKPNPSVNFRSYEPELDERDEDLEERDEDFLEERGIFSKTPKPFNPEKTPNKLKKAQPIPKVPNKQPKTSNTLKKEKKGPKPNPSVNFRSYESELEERGLFSKTAKPFNPEKTPNKLKKAQPIPKVPNKQPKTSNTLKKEKKGPKPNPSVNFRSYEPELDERDEDFLEERDDEFLDERDEEFLDERDEDFLEERDEDFLDERDEDLIEERGLFSKTPKPFNPEKTPNKLKKAQPIPKVPNKQPKTSNTLTKEKKQGKKNPATNF